ncbi:hypothetical protein C8J36_103293 [Rhizobium sp. PP-F2F-G48]|nr:hypothetical protein C8J36_103293 [Rhizobium sp. PP-F2F-G48]
MNGWLRDSAPINTGAAVATGSNVAETVRAGQAGHPLSGVFDVAAQLESKSDPTKHAPMA